MQLSKLTKAKSKPKFKPLFFQVNRVRYSRPPHTKPFQGDLSGEKWAYAILKHWTKFTKIHEKFLTVIINFTIGLRGEEKDRKEPT